MFGSEQEGIPILQIVFKLGVLLEPKYLWQVADVAK